MPISTCIFDAYGTLFDVASAARQVAAEPGREKFAEKWLEISRTWREKQLGYTWLRAVADAHTDFWQVTQDALDFTLELHGFDDASLRERLLELYWNLSAYPEVPDVLARLQGANLATGILSNGSPEMLDGAVASAGIAQWLDVVLSVEDVGVFKPHRWVYDLVGSHFGCEPSEVLFVSSNGWDAAHAAGYGFQTAWINRAGDPVDRLDWKPQHILTDLSGIPDLAADL
jgi:2-haloacid dehalogenase